VNRDANRPRYDRSQWHFQNRPSHRYHWRGQSYVQPYGFYPHSWAYGEILPWGWYTPNYYIDDWSYYGLEPAPYGCEWVREGADAVLVDVYTGRVLSVEYGLFF
jgi:Ni/Co efflux regulator RcnB